jgi:uncharacterized protein (TIGR02118 family)
MSRLWVRLRKPGAPPAAAAIRVHAVRRPKEGEPDAVELFDRDPGLPDAFAVDANAVVDGPADALFLAVLHRRADVDHAFFSRYWRDDHAVFGPQIPGVRRYVQLHAVDGAPVDGVCEVGFDSIGDLAAGLQSDVIAIDARADEERFIDHSRSYGLVCEGGVSR